MTITAEEASAKFMSLLDQITEGEPVTITRQGIPVAKLVLAEEENEPDELLNRIKAFSQRHTGGKPHIRELIDEGRQH